MQLDKIKITDIEPASYNPRTINNEQYDKLSRSIQEYGLVDPIIINLQNNKIIGGHQRYKVLLDEYASTNQDLYLLQLGDIGWVFPNTDLKIDSEEHEKALNIILNQQNLMGEWDSIKLENVLNDLNDLDFDLSLTGFNDEEIDIYLDDDYSEFQFSQEDDGDSDDDLPSDYVDVTGDVGDDMYILTIGFEDTELANKFLDYLGYSRHLTRKSLQLLFSDLELDLDELLLEKYGEDYFKEQ